MSFERYGGCGDSDGVEGGQGGGVYPREGCTRRNLREKWHCPEKLSIIVWFTGDYNFMEEYSKKPAENPNFSYPPIDAQNFGLCFVEPTLLTPNISIARPRLYGLLTTCSLPFKVNLGVIEFTTHRNGCQKPHNPTSQRLLLHHLCSLM